MVLCEIKKPKNPKSENTASINRVNGRGETVEDDKEDKEVLTLQFLNSGPRCRVKLAG